jgi:predicted flap endonuclease-1-like 5' DNA nuclease
MADLVLGPSGGNGGHEFSVYTIPAGAKVHEIRVNAGFYVDGLQLVYIDADGTVQEMPHLGGKGGFRHTITLAGDEYLTGISGRSGRYVDSIRFHTSQRTTDSIGGRGGENEYHFEAAANGEVAGFFGRADWYVDQLGVIIRERVLAAGTVATKAAKSTKAAKPAAPAEAVPAQAATAKAAASKVAAPKVTKAKPAAATAETPAAKPAAKSRKKTAPATELIAIPDSAPVTPPASDLVAVPESAPVPPPAPDLVGIPQSGPVDAVTPELVGVPGSAPVEVESASTVAGARTSSVEIGEPTQADDLIKIEGIGPKIAQVLADAGISTFAALADTPVARLREILNAAGSRYRITDPTTWPEQAALAARGDWAAFDDLVARLKAGKRA